MTSNYAVDEINRIKRYRRNKFDRMHEASKHADCTRIAYVAYEYGFHDIGTRGPKALMQHTAESLWSELSDDVAATWLCLPDNDLDLFEKIKPYLPKEPFNSTELLIARSGVKRLALLADI
jgi:hypothetical protein